MEQKRTVREYMKKLFDSATDKKTTDSINIHNIRNVYAFSLIACIVDALSLALFAAMNWNKPGFWRTFINVGICVTACALVIILAKRIIRKYEKEGAISNSDANALVTFFYMVMSAWGIMVDAVHYADGDQMLTFYIVQFCFLCFVVMRPKTGSILIAVCFSALYLRLYFVDGAARMQPQNYLIFAVIAVFGNAIQYMTLRESEISKSNIIELNQMLQQEASFDDLTKLKNRKALRNDFNKNIGKHVYVIMADVDHFKSYNDAYGHVVGDMVLRRVAAATRESFSDGDAYRYGGDELLIILADYSDERFIEAVEKWKRAIQAIEIPNVALSISCSFGYERCLVRSTDNLRAAIKTADDRLYEEKKAKQSNRE